MEASSATPRARALRHGATASRGPARLQGNHGGELRASETDSGEAAVVEEALERGGRRNEDAAEPEPRRFAAEPEPRPSRKKSRRRVSPRRAATREGARADRPQMP